MAQLTRLFLFRHLRSEATRHVVHYRSGHKTLSARGASFWFLPMSASVSEVPVDDQELPVVFAARTGDFQAVTTQGVVTWRVSQPEVAAERLDFSLNLDKGTWGQQPLVQVGSLLGELAQQIANAWLGEAQLSVALTTGVEELRARILAGLRADQAVASLGLEIVGVRIASIRPEVEVERALQTPTREAIQQEADKATFERRAVAVERERAISENELKTKIELARREQDLIVQKGTNEKRRLTEEAEALKIKANAELERQAAATRAEVERSRLTTAAESSRLREIGEANNETEQSRVAIYSALPAHVLMGLAAQQLAENLPTIQNLTFTPDMLSAALGQLAAPRAAV
jgi:regulator of protease activity HflC (stomatin/prohibitin superfamily)